MADKQLNEKQLQALLRLKRYEQPPPGYFDNLLSNIHQRQREEMLRRPAWRLAIERVKTFFESMRFDWRYAGTMAGVLLTGIGLIQIALPKQQTVNTVTSTPTSVKTTPVQYQPAITLSNPGQNILPPLQSVPANQYPTLSPPLRRVAVPARPGTQPPPQFVGGSLPASYEPTQIRF